MNLRRFIKYLQDILEADPANGELEVYTVHGASGVAEPLSSSHVAEFDGRYPEELDLKNGEKYVSVYSGN